MSAITNRGSTFAISTAAANTAIDATAAAALTYTTIGQVGSFGERGLSTNVVSYDFIGETVSDKAKGTSNAGDPTMEVARDEDDAGQDLLRTYGAANDYNKYVLKVVKQDGTTFYHRGLVTGPVDQGGRNEDFDLEVFTFGLVQDAIRVAST